MMNALIEALYFPLVEIMANIDHYYSIELETYFPSNKLCNRSTLDPYRRRHDLPNIEKNIGYDLGSGCGGGEGGLVYEPRHGISNNVAF